jgi:cysteine-rich repeat protein
VGATGGGAGSSAAGGSANVTGGASGDGGTNASGASSGSSGSGAGGTASGGAGAGTSGSAGAAGSGGGSVCGNGKVEGAETCDDGNTTTSDGCSATCTVETGFACGGAPSACNRSCNGLTKTCGPNSDQDCCASNLVTGNAGSNKPFYRGYDGVTYTDQSSPATVSDFRLDVYEVTVGRFRKFVAAYSQSLIPGGAGKNPNNPSDPGWDTTWNSSLPSNASALTTSIKCDATFQTWTDSAGTSDNLPLNCLTWYAAAAFCIWDGGRLPTEAEWDYAAAGGTAQREYPWGSADPDCSFANFTGSTTVSARCVNPPNGATNRVGSESPKGDGLYGQTDLSGNVWEWAQDWYAASYPTPCDNCANATSASFRVVRGGTFFSIPSFILASYRSEQGPLATATGVGARCARTAL